MGQDRLAAVERAEAGDRHHDQHDHGVDDRLGPQHRQPLGHGGEAGTDHPGAVLATDDQHAEHADGQLGQDVQAQAELRAVDGVAVAAAVAGVRPSDQRVQADHDEDGHQQSDRGGAQGA